LIYMKNLYKVGIVLLLAIAIGFYFYRNYKSEVVIEPLKVSSADAPVDKLITRVIKDKSFDKKNGLNIEFSYTAPGETVRVISEKVGGVEVGSIPTLSLVEVNSKGHDLVAFAPLIWGSLDFIVDANSHYQSLDNLKGARVAIRPKVSAAYKSLALAMKVAGFNLEKDYRLTFGSIPDNLASFFKKEVDAVLSVPFGGADLIAEGKVRTVLDLESRWRNTTGSRMSFAMMSAHKSWIDAHPETFKKVSRVFLEAEKYVFEHPEIVADYKDMLGIKTEKGLEVAKNDVKRVIPDSWDPEVHKMAIKKAIEFGLVPNIPYDDFFIK